ncbi:uncharacterized protein LOC108031632 isoform X4 [Drosophila biarmipes]|uniref:uncharacterized protein LOC108031632 isoform X4 n=1 Tax=Drosophila biarmipes TaxID=125945 RepID=UPI0021CC5782|nr:uncharacterized protein LOC108031632 isoform X4 [Drosophila biarmipes]
MRQQFKVAFRKLIRRCKSIRTRSFCCDAKLLGKQQLIPPLFTWTTSSPRNYSKFSTHITTERAMDLLCNLDEKERSNLRFALDKIDADKEKKLYESFDPPSAVLLNILNGRSSANESLSVYGSRLVTSLLTKWKGMSQEEIAVSLVLAHTSQIEPRLQA